MQLRNSCISSLNRKFTYAQWNESIARQQKIPKLLPCIAEHNLENFADQKYYTQSFTCMNVVCRLQYQLCTAAHSLSHIFRMRKSESYFGGNELTCIWTWLVFHVVLCAHKIRWINAIYILLRKTLKALNPFLMIVFIALSFIYGHKMRTLVHSHVHTNERKGKKTQANFPTLFSTWFRVCNCEYCEYNIKK